MYAMIGISSKKPYLVDIAYANGMNQVMGQPFTGSKVGTSEGKFEKACYKFRLVGMRSGQVMACSCLSEKDP